ncbi:MAG: Diguanylate cyclase DgcM [Pseudomonadota bacterium]|jgi:diguanylate cyclase (GGDEF)-like protein
MNNNKPTSHKDAEAPAFGPKKAYGLAVTVVLLTTLYALAILFISPPVEHVDYASLVTEALVSLLPAAGLFVIQGLSQVRKAYWPMLAGLTGLTVSMTTDTLDELVDMADILNTVFEGVFQVIGFSLLLIGLRQWVRHNQGMAAELQKLATTDYLTSAFNRRHFVETLEVEAARSDRHNTPVSVILLDVDRFKRVNDLHGHDAGDAVLEHVSRILQTQIRKEDTFARYGGEEFAVLVPHADVVQVQQLAEKLRASLQASPLPAVGTVTASFGVVQYQTTETVQQLLKRADQALYAAKSAGRNCVRTGELLQ